MPERRHELTASEVAVLRVLRYGPARIGIYTRRFVTPTGRIAGTVAGRDVSTLFDLELVKVTVPAPDAPRPWLREAALTLSGRIVIEQIRTYGSRPVSVRVEPRRDAATFARETDPKNEPAEPAFYHVAQTGVEREAPPHAVELPGAIVSGNVSLSDLCRASREGLSDQEIEEKIDRATARRDAEQSFINALRDERDRRRRAKPTGRAALGLSAEIAAWKRGGE
jgi:hypothetical protein